MCSGTRCRFGRSKLADGGVRYFRFGLRFNSSRISATQHPTTDTDFLACYGSTYRQIPSDHITAVKT